MPKELVAEVESAPELESTSESEQMYLITVARAAEVGIEGPVAISKIAETLAVSVPSANEMIRKLDNRGLLVYQPYRGVLLSETGRRIADQVLRTRRLWATFLADHLGFSPAEADHQACDLEHSTSAEAANRLATFLGNPEAGPLGRPIPKPESSEHRRPTVRLADVPVGASAEVITVTARDRTRDFLAAEGITAGARIAVAAAGASGWLIDIDGRDLHLSDRLDAAIEVRLTGNANAPA